MKSFFRNLLVFFLFAAAAAALNYLPYQDFLAAQGRIDPEFLIPLDHWSPELNSAWATFASTALAGVLLIIFGLAWSFLRAWKPFAITLGSGTLLNGALLAFSQSESGPPWLPLLFILTIPLAFVAVVYGAFLSLKSNLILLTLYRLVSATTLAIIITVLFPFLVVAAGLYLKRQRGLKFSEVWSESPQLYNFLMVNLYPIFFEILPGFRKVLADGRLEEKRERKRGAPKFQCTMDLSQLQAGDVFLTGADNLRQAVPIQVSNCLSNSYEDSDRPWCHAAIYAGDGKIIEAQSGGQGVIETRVTDFFPGGKNLRVFRHRFMSAADLQKAVDFCASQKGCPYDTWGVSFYGLAALIPPMLSGWLESPFAERFFNVDNAYFCSELVADGFKAAGHDIFKRKSWRVKPLDFAYTPLFDEITVQCGYQRWPASEPAPPALA